MDEMLEYVLIEQEDIKQMVRDNLRGAFLSRPNTLLNFGKCGGVSFHVYAIFLREFFRHGDPYYELPEPEFSMFPPRSVMYQSYQPDYMDGKAEYFFETYETFWEDICKISEKIIEEKPGYKNEIEETLQNIKLLMDRSEKG